MLNKKQMWLSLRTVTVGLATTVALISCGKKVQEIKKSKSKAILGHDLKAKKMDQER